MEQDLFSEIVELHFYKITLLKLKVHATRPPTDSILTFYPEDYKYIVETHKLGNHPKELPYPPLFNAFR